MSEKQTRGSKCCDRRKGAKKGRQTLSYTSTGIFNRSRQIARTKPLIPGVRSEKTLNTDAMSAPPPTTITFEDSMKTQNTRFDFDFLGRGTDLLRSSRGGGGTSLRVTFVVY